MSGHCPTPLKVTFDDREAAEGRIERSLRSGAHGPGDREAYECVCGFFHVRPTAVGYARMRREYPDEIASINAHQEEAPDA